MFQDVGLHYLEKYCDTSGLREAINTDPIHFYTFKMKWDDNTNYWSLKLHKKLSTNTEGIRKLLAGTPVEQFPTVEEFIENIKRKLSQ